MVYLYGGTFIFGSSKLDPSPLLQKGVIVVTLNYRLGPLGFLTLGDDPYVSGNQGMKDQVLALRYVKKILRINSVDDSPF